MTWKAPFKNKRERAKEKVLLMEELPSTPVDAMGIDVGKAGFHISIPTENIPAAMWNVWYFDYEEHPEWHERLVQLCKPGTVIVAEPTGWHYLAPIANIIQRKTKARLYLIDHQISGKIRAAKISSQKTDQTDARALALVAQDIRERRAVRGVSYHDQEIENYVIQLRLLVNSFTRTSAEIVRIKNCLRQLGHGIFPTLAIGDIWFSCMRYGQVTPSQIKAWVAGERPSEIKAHTWTAYKKFAERLPSDIEASPVIAEAALNLANRMFSLEGDLEVIQKQIESVVVEYPFDVITKRWMTVPYATLYYCACLHVATHGRADQFTTEQFKAALGAFPQVRASGTT